MALRIKKNILLAPLSTFNIGGKAEYAISVKSSASIIEAFKWAQQRNLPFYIIAGGSNIVFPDGILKGLLIHIQGGRIRRTAPLTLIADAGVQLKRVIQTSLAYGMQGMETLSGIPGTVGGAVVGNAGAYGHSISELVQNVKAWDGTRIVELSNNDCNFEYRESIFKIEPYIVLNTTLVFRRGKPDNLKKRSKKILALRRKKYNQTLNCPGSFFKNILIKDISPAVLKRIGVLKIIDGKIPAGYLLDQVGAHGMKRGRAQVAKFHANILINCGGATARDVRNLTRVLKQRVKSRFDIELKEEVQFLH